MALLKYIETLETNIDLITHIHGQIIYCSDTDNTYYDNRLSRVVIYDTIKLNIDSDKSIIIDPNPYKIYISRDLGKFYRYYSDTGVFKELTETSSIQFILTDKIELIPTTLTKKGVAYAPRTLASCVYDDEGNDILHSLVSSGMTIKSFSIKDNPGWYRVAKANIQKYSRATFLIFFNSPEFSGYLEFIISSEVNKDPEYIFIDYTGTTEIEKIRFAKKIDNTAYIDILTKKPDIDISTILIVNNGWQNIPIRKVTDEGCPEGEDPSLYQLVEFNTNNLDNLLKRNVDYFSGAGNVTKIEHGLGKMPVAAFIQPFENQNGEQGEYWVTYDDTYLYVYNTGISLKAFYWITISPDNLNDNLLHGTYNFGGTGKICTISHNLNRLPASILICPTEDTGDTCGDYWVEYDYKNIYVMNTGTYTGKFNILIIFGVDNSNYMINDIKFTDVSNGIDIYNDQNDAILVDIFDNTEFNNIGNDIVFDGGGHDSTAIGIDKSMEKYIKCGVSNFNESKVTIIPHGLGVEPASVFVTPSEDTKGTLGEYWVNSDTNNIYVYNFGGENATGFYWTAFIGKSKNDGVISNILINLIGDMSGSPIELRNMKITEMIFYLFKLIKDVESKIPTLQDFIVNSSIEPLKNVLWLEDI